VKNIVENNTKYLVLRRLLLYFILS